MRSSITRLPTGRAAAISAASAYCSFSRLRRREGDVIDLGKVVVFGGQPEDGGVRMTPRWPGARAPRRLPP